MRPSRSVLLVLAPLALAGCTVNTNNTYTDRQCHLGHDTMAAELLFGLSRQDGGEVSPADFDAFVTDTIAPRFPNGYTVLPGTGAWQGPDGHIVHEGARLVLISAPDEDATRTRLNEVRKAYKTQFRQKSVGLITTESCADFQ